MADGSSPGSKSADSEYFDTNLDETELTEGDDYLAGRNARPRLKEEGWCRMMLNPMNWCCGRAETCYECFIEMNPIVSVIIVAFIFGAIGTLASIPVWLDDGSTPLENMNWTDINVTSLRGTTFYDYFGEDVDLTPDGETVAIAGRHINRSGAYD